MSVREGSLRRAVTRGAALLAIVAAGAGCPLDPPILGPTDPPISPTAIGCVRVDERVHPGLRRELDRVGPNDKVPILIFLERQLSRDERLALRPQIDAAPDPASRKRIQREALVNALKQVATASQGSVLATLQDATDAGRAADTRSLWIVNALGTEATRDAVACLSRDPAIRRISFDPIGDRTGTTTSWGVTQIGADDVWGGFTPRDGTGVIVAVVDDGFDYEHPDLRERLWLNPGEDHGGDGTTTNPCVAAADGIFRAECDVDGVDDDANDLVDDVIGWNFGLAEFSPPGHWDPAEPGNRAHGTSIAGNIAGDGHGFGGTSIATGVAPDASLMLLRYYKNQNGGNQVAALAAIEYALERDAPVINFSSGWRSTDPTSADAPDYAAWREMVNNVMDGGSLFVTITHQGDQDLAPPHQIRTPGSVPSALTVGATYESDQILETGNIGPTSWEDVPEYADHPYPPGLMKPDLVAPGVDVPAPVPESSTQFPYALATGSSTGAAHVSGLAALLLDANPGLTGHDLITILKDNALALPVGGTSPNNVYGWGRVQAVESVDEAMMTGDYDLEIRPAGTPSTPLLWGSPDIWIDNDGDGRGDPLLPGRTNLVNVRVHNVGAAGATNVEVEAWWLPIGVGGVPLLDPDGDGDPSDGSFFRIGAATIPLLGPAGSSTESDVVAIPWETPDEPGFAACLGGSANAGYPSPSEVDTSNNVATDNVLFIPHERIARPLLIRFLHGPDPGPYRLLLDRSTLPAVIRVGLAFEREVADELLPRASGFEVERRSNLRGTDRLRQTIFWAVDPRAQLEILALRELEEAGPTLVVDSTAAGPADWLETRGQLVNLELSAANGTPVGGLTVVVRQPRPIIPIHILEPR